MIDDQYYKGFEGEPEYIIRNSEDEGYSIWGGYFSTIMDAGSIFSPGEGGLSYYWNFCVGFEDGERNWKIPSLDKAISEIAPLDRSNKSFEESSEIMIKDTMEVKDVLLKFLEDAKEKNLDVYVEYD